MAGEEIVIHDQKLPTIQELYANPSLVLAKDQVLQLLNQPPPAKWVAKHPFIANYEYLPIDKVEFLLKKLFKGYRIDVKKTGQLFNAVEVQVRVNYIDIVTGEWTYQEGVGAHELQTASKSGTLKPDFSNVNPGAVAMALPIAKTVAIKDACDHIGDIFGANLNRKGIIPVSPDAELEKVAKTKEEDRLAKLIEKAKDRAALEGLKTHLTEKLQAQFDAKWNQLQ